MNQIKLIQTGNLIGILSVLFFFLCILWEVLLFEPNLKEFHMNLMRVMYPGFGTNLLGIIIGVVEAFMYGWIIGSLLAWLRK